MTNEFSKYEKMERYISRGDRYMELAQSYENRRAYSDASVTFRNAFNSFTIAEDNARKINASELNDILPKKQYCHNKYKENEANYRAVASDNPGLKPYESLKHYHKDDTKTI